VTGRRGRRRRKLLDDLKERRGYSHLKEEALDRTMWRARFGRGFGPVVRQTTKRNITSALTTMNSVSRNGTFCFGLQARLPVSRILGVGGGQMHMQMEH
jgi:hypothetical protein